ncbi:3-oxoacyl-ACP reductase family protein [Immundisolibacter sp.]|jgi:3-oxoacyl-(acyl-carrier-protein) reductase|uniref:3-oxoacyl-ACP reductase family protein n=1 Tax=Immundisolibacter sp. TaxID=1934948 RepID=UPI0019C0571B|nr:3-oxoacyl-ACP reductase family protein [Immundisolibacter sp.]MBC7162286.1 3-oxoacyl-ACP reductase FabG [Immundisolibacter sp.]MEA3220645.1 3-oxoacyl-[acyl-carrier-protein] reductase FabG [Immundisolibacter sp.]
MSQARQVAIVSGSSRGIGRAIALELARRGMAVVVNYRSAEAEAKAVAGEVRALGVDCLCLQADVADPDQARGLIGEVQAQWGRIDVLVNNAGITRDKTLRKLTDDDWLQVINTNLGSVYYCTSAVMPIMIEQSYGRIINISSYVGQAGNFGQANYGASKGGIIAFTKTAALELARYGITVNAIAPGFTETEMLSKVPPDVQEKIRARIPMGRFGKAQEVAKVVAFIATEADYITGQQINVNGGVYM